MKVKLLVMGKTTHDYVADGCAVFFKRLPHYTNFSYHVIDDLKNNGKLSVDKRKQEEGKKILQALKPNDLVVLLDEKGKALTSVQFADWIAQKQMMRISQLVFIIGGAFGFSKEVYTRADFKMQLSNLTFSHQLIRLIFIEQLYRAFTILKGEPYHNA